MYLKNYKKERKKKKCVKSYFMTRCRIKTLESEVGFLLAPGLPETQGRGCIPEPSTKPVRPVAAPASLEAALVLSLPSPQEESSNPNPTARGRGQEPSSSQRTQQQTHAGQLAGMLETTPKPTRCPDPAFTPPDWKAEVFSLKSFDVLTPRVRNGTRVFTGRLQLPPFLQYNRSRAAQSR